jgi:hypothetical protein
MSLKGVIDKFLTFFGDIKVFSFPMFVVYDPGSYRVKGEDIRKLIATVKPGDILVRGFKNYLDGYFIPGYFSHAGVYLGPVQEKDLELVSRPEGKKLFRTGEQMVVHALAEGVLMEDLIQFCRCDYMAVLRFPEKIRRSSQAQPLPIPDHLYHPAEKAVSKRLDGGEEILFSEALPVIFRVALENLGRPYDFNFDFASFARLSCTELVYFCTKCLGPFLDISPIERRVLFIKKAMIPPDAFVRSRLELIWSNSSVDREKIARQKSSPTY